VLIGAGINSAAQVGDAPCRIVTDRARFEQLACGSNLKEAVGL